MLQKNIADVPEKKLKQSLHECNLFDEVFQNSHFAENTRVFSTPSDIFDVPFHTASKVSVFGVILVRIFPHSDLMRRDTPYVSVFSPKCEKIRTRITPNADTFYAVLSTNQDEAR